ncbi:MAG: hypothetical protein ACRBF0_00605 [Calditrichia bacterium]
MSKDLNAYKVLVLGVDERAALAVIRSLGRRDITVHQGSDFAGSVCQYSKYNSKVIEFPKAAQDPDAWVERLIEILSTEQYDLVIPTADNYLVPMARNRAKLEPLAKLAIPEDRGFEYTYDKGKTFELAESLGVPCPRSVEISSTENLDEVLKEFTFPIIVKPVSSKVWQKSQRFQMDVSLVKDREALEAKLNRQLSICPALLQTFHTGVGVGQYFLMQEGRMIAGFQHQRVHEPLKGGGSSYRKSRKLDEELKVHSLNMLSELKWTGVAMVEYKQDLKTGATILIEINGRFWGSLPLALQAGVDFPYYLFEMLVNKKLPDNFVEGKGVPYKENVYCRNFAKDFDWLKENIRADKSDPYSLTVPMPTVLAEARHWFMGRDHFDTLQLDDMKPGIKHVSRYIKGNFQGAGEKLHKLALKFKYGKNLPVIWMRKRKLKQLLHKNADVNFICKGNICRSPFAEFYLKKRFEENGMNSIRITSVGTLQKQNRQSPEFAIEAAASFDVDMRSHRSKIITQNDIDSYGLLFVMDTELYDKVLEEFPNAKEKLFFLGEMADGYPKVIDIIDPYGSKVGNFKRIYKQIITSVDDLIGTMKQLGIGK